MKNLAVTTKGDSIAYDWIEIGACNFGSLTQESEDNNAVGISVEPIVEYLDSLPDQPNVIKVNRAITNIANTDTVKLYYIPEDVINENGLPHWSIGTNKIGDYHIKHIKHNWTHLVKIIDVKLQGISDFLNEYKVRRLKFLKIDTEGHDCIILDGLYNHLQDKDDSFYPDKILFETNSLTPKKLVDSTLEKFSSLGYRVVSRNTGDTIIEYNGYRR